MLRPFSPGASAWPGLPDDALEGVRRINVAELIEGDPIHSGIACGRHKHQRNTSMRVHVHDLFTAKVADQERPGRRMKREAEQNRRRWAGDSHLPKQLAIRLEYKQRRGPVASTVGIETGGWDVDVAIGADRQTLHRNRRS